MAIGTPTTTPAPATGSSQDRVMLEARQLTRRFGGLVAVNGVDLRMPTGSILSVIGPNGAGKKTFFNMVTGLIKPSSGQLIFDGRNVTARPPHYMTRIGMARTFQNIRLFAN
ncbi:ATP-binding cassette domain-containing protein, partial [Streptomyces sp. PRKS01-29]